MTANPEIATLAVASPRASRTRASSTCCSPICAESLAASASRSTKRRALYRRRLLVARIDVRARCPRRHDPGNAASASMKATPIARCLPIAGTLVPVPGAAMKASRRFRRRCATTTARRSSAIHATCSRACCERFHALRLTPVVAIELEFYLLDPRAHGRRARPAAAAAGARSSRLPHADQLDGRPQ